MKTFLKPAILTSAIITLSACGIMSSPNDYSHASSKATIADKPLSVVQKDVDTLILESSQRIEKQLSLLNETKQQLVITKYHLIKILKNLVIVMLN